MAVSNSTDRFNGVLASKAIKVPVKRATNVNQVLSGDPGAIDGWTWSNGDRILLYGQTNPVENGIWEVNLSSDWKRAPDFDGTRDATESTLITAGRSGSDNPLMYVLTTDADPIRIGTDALAFQIYFDPDNPAAAGLQAVTDVGNTTTNAIIINPTVANQPYLTITNAGRIVLENTTADGDINFGNIAPTGFSIDANGITDLFQFSGFDEFRVLGTGAPAGAVFVMGERNPISNPLPGPIAAFATIWVRDDTPNVLVFTDDAGTDWILNGTLQTVTDAGNTTTNDIELVGSNLLLDDAGEVQFGTVAGGEINIRYDAAANALEVYDASGSNTDFVIGPGINNLVVNTEANANSTLRIGENATLRGDSQQAILNMYGEDTNVIVLAQVQNTGALWWFNAPTLPIRFDGTDFLMDTVNARIRGVVASPLEEKRLYFEDSDAVAQFRIGTQSNGDVEIRNLSQDDSIRIMGTLTGGAAHTYFDGHPNSATRVSAAPGRDVSIGIGTNDYIFCDNLGNLDFFYLGTSNVVRMTSAAGGSLLVNQTETGESGTFSRALTSFDLGLDAEFWFFDFSPGTTDPTQQRFKFNNADPTLVTILTLDDIAISDRDPVDILGTIQAGTQIRLAQTTDLSIWAVYEATGPAVDNTTHFSIPVAYVAHNGTFPTATRPPFKFTFANTASAPVSAASPTALVVGKWTYSSAVNLGTVPASQSIEFSNATPTSANRMFLDDQDADNVDWRQHMIDAWSNGFGTLVRMRKADDPQTYMVWSINTFTAQGGYVDAYINMIEWEGTWTNGDEIYVEIQTQAYVAPATVDNGVYFSRATLSGQPRCGPQQSSVFRLLSNGWEVFNSGFNVQWTQSGDSVTVSGADYFRWNTEGRHEWYGAANVLPVVTIFESLVEFGHDNHAGNGAPVLRVKERTSQGAVEAGWGQIWVRNDTPNSLIFTDDAGNDYDLTDPGAAATTISAGWTTGSGGSITLAANAPLIHTEQATDDSPTAGQGQFWVRDDTPNAPIFSDDANLQWPLKQHFEQEFAYSSTTTAGDPGPTIVRFDSTTPASITNMYIDTDSISENYEWVLGALSVGDVIVVKSAVSDLEYLVATVSATPTDNVGWWTVPLTIIANGSIFTDADPVRISAQFVGQSKIADGTVDNTLLRWDSTAGEWTEIGNDLQISSDVAGVTEITTVDSVLELDSSSQVRVVAGNFYGQYTNNNSFMLMTLRGGVKSLQTGSLGGNLEVFAGNGNSDLALAGGTGLFIQEKASAHADVTGYGQLWTRTTDGHLYYTGDDGVDHDLINVGAAAQTITAGWSTGSGGSITLAANAPIFYTEQSADDAPAAGEGQVWVRDSAPNTLMFTDDAGNDYPVAGIGARQIKYKTADETVNNSTTLQDDDHITGIELEAGAYYRYTFTAYCTVRQNSDFKWQWIFSQTPQDSWHQRSWSGQDPVQDADITVVNTYLIATGVTGHALVETGYFQANATTGGTLKLQWAQNTAQVEDTQVLKGSNLVVERMS